MKLYKYWVRISGELSAWGDKEVAHCYGHSNHSYADAEKNGQEQLKKIQQKIDGETDIFEDYSAVIREEIIETVSPQNIVTRNRYGALVLNSEDTFFIDIDDYTKSFWELISFKRITDPKKAIVSRVEKISEGLPDFGIRIYETAAGIRLIVENCDFSSASNRAQELFRTFGTDYLYAMLCAKQECFRARLTPKSYRMRFKARRNVFPRADEAEDKAYHEWVDAYNQACERFATCHLIKKIGRCNGSSIIDYHDRMTKAMSDLPLA